MLLGDVSRDLPLAVFGTIMIVASFFFLWMQEPRGQPLLQTLEDMEKQETKTIMTTLLGGLEKEESEERPHMSIGNFEISAL